MSKGESYRSRQGQQQLPFQLFAWRFLESIKQTKAVTIIRAISDRCKPRNQYKKTSRVGGVTCRDHCDREEGPDERRRPCASPPRQRSSFHLGHPPPPSSGRRSRRSPRATASRASKSRSRGCGDGGRGHGDQSPSGPPAVSPRAAAPRNRTGGSWRASSALVATTAERTGLLFFCSPLVAFILVLPER